MNAFSPLPHHARAIHVWLMVCLSLVAVMVFIGGITRLTESGLSIVEWKLFSGTLPPMSEEAWLREFEEYKQTPQFAKVNAHFSLSDFQGIYWLEYIHRLLGRVIGLAALLPFLYFSVRGMLPKRLFWRCFAINLLIMAQGAVGWVMVASGLVDQPRVAPIKLSAHLLLAFSVFCLMLWTRWQVRGDARDALSPAKALGQLARTVIALVVVQIFFGALVAGLRAGLTYNTFPLMDGQWIPSGLHLLHPWWANHLESPLTVQFQHRIGALLVFAATLWTTLRGWHTALRPLVKWIFIVTLTQVLLGIATLLSVVHIWLASAHQLAALLLLSLLLRLVYRTPLDANQHPTKIVA